MQSGFAAARQLLGLEQRPTAIFAANDLMALGAIYAIQDAGLRVTERAPSLEAAVSRAAELAGEAGRQRRTVATVLLSPAAASFDMFEDYEARGRAFKAAVARLQDEAG